MSTIQRELIGNGYKKHVSQSYRSFHSTDTLFQKRIRDNKGTKYFIDCWWYDNSAIPTLVEIGKGEMVQFECQFYNVDNSAVMNVTLFEKDVSKVEEYFEKIWIGMNLGYYEKEIE